MSLESADYAVKTAPWMAEPYYVRGMILEEQGRNMEALEDYKKSENLRPRDYRAWFRTGVLSEELGLYEEALEALKRSVELAPFYSRPRWSYGEAIGKYKTSPTAAEEKWQQLRLAARFDPAILWALTEKAYLESSGDAEKASALLDLKSDLQKLFFGVYLLKYGAVIDAMPYLCQNAELNLRSRDLLVKELIKIGHFKAAFEAEKEICSKNYKFQIQNAGFENPIRKMGANFDWQLAENTNKVNFTIEDLTNSESGKKVLQIEFDGFAAGSNQLILSQMVLTEPDSRYELEFRFKTEKLLGDARPQISVSSVADEKGVIALGEQLPLGTNAAWTNGKIKFNTSHAEAVKIAVIQSRCSFKVCPVFGKILLDDFKLSKLN